jgi:hypothetical protein
MKFAKIILLMVTAFFASSCFASTERVTIELTLKEHKFIPEKVEAPEGKVLVLLISNQDDIVEEFESIDLKREKIVPPHGKAKVVVGPLKAGEYKFFGEFYDPQPQGVLVVVKE